MLIMGKRGTIVSSGLHLLFLSTHVAAHTLRASTANRDPSTPPAITKIIQQTTVQRYDSGNLKFEDVEQQDTDLLDCRAPVYGEHVPEILSLPGFSWPRPSTRISPTISQKPAQSSSVKISEPAKTEMITTFDGEKHTTLSPSIPLTPLNPLQERDSAYWRLRVHISHIDGLLEIYMRSPQAIAFCENIPFEGSKPKETSEEDSTSKENNTSTYYELLLGEGDIAANIKIPEEDAIRFCETVTRWVDTDWRTRSRSASRKATRTTPTSTKASVATSTTSTTKSASESSAKRTLTRWSRSRRTRSTHPRTSSSPQTSYEADKTVNVSLSSNREISSSTSRSSWPPPGFETDEDFFTLFSSIESSRASLTAPSTSTPTPSAEALEGEDTSTAKGLAPSTSTTTTRRIRTISFPPTKHVGSTETETHTTVDTQTSAIHTQSPVYQYPHVSFLPPSPIPSTPPSPSPSPTQVPPAKSSSRAAWDKIHDPAIMWTVVFGWTLVGLQIVVGGWEFARNARGDVHLGLRVVRGVRRVRGVFA